MDEQTFIGSMFHHKRRETTKQKRELGGSFFSLHMLFSTKMYTFALE